MRHRLAVALRVRTLLVLAILLLCPEPSPAQSARYDINGFRDARFGMTEPEVRAVARASFGAKDEEMTLRTNSVDGTTMLLVHARKLEPGLPEGRIVYQFGYQSRRLIQVDVIWGEDTNQPLNDSGMVEGGARLQRFFLGFAWRPGSVRAGFPIGDNTVLLFGGEDDRKGAVRLTIDGIRYQTTVNGVFTTSPDPQTAPKLTVTYVADRIDPDIRRITRADF
jgi:hypothetical protein